MKKTDIRPLYMQKRNTLTDKEVLKLDDLMLIQFQQLDLDIPSLIMTYSPIQKLNEFDPILITDYCSFKNPGQQLLYPVMVKNADAAHLISVMVDEKTTFATNKFGIAEPVDGTDMYPEEIDLVIVPLLAFDSMGNRVGYGKGYYDQFLKLCRKDCINIGFSYFEALDHIDDTNNQDVKIDYCITPTTIYQF